MTWIYIEREEFIRMCDKNDVSIETREAIKQWAPSVSNKSETPRSKRIYQSPKNTYEAWSAGIPNPNSNKGKSGGYRIVYFLNLKTGSINLDFIENRKELGFRKEGHKRKDKYNNYIQELKKYLKELDI